MQTRPRRDCARLRRSPVPLRRRAVIVLELLLFLPLFMILIAAIIEFALLLIGIQHVQLASRAGAKVASELSTTDLGSPMPANNADVVKAAADKVLSSVGYSSCQIILEHTADCSGLVPGSINSTMTCTGCTAPSITLPNTMMVPSGVVRVTVCVPATSLTPDLLSTFGFSIASRLVSVSSTLPYENCP